MSNFGTLLTLSCITYSLIIQLEKRFVQHLKLFFYTNVHTQPDPTNTTMGKNTDGFDVRNSTNIVIRNSVVFNQDDCVAINSGCNFHLDQIVGKQ